MSSTQNWQRTKRIIRPWEQLPITSKTWAWLPSWYTTFTTHPTITYDWMVPLHRMLRPGILSTITHRTQQHVPSLPTNPMHTLLQQPHPTMPSPQIRQTAFPNCRRCWFETHQAIICRVVNATAQRFPQWSVKMNTPFPCPVIGCKHYPTGPGKKFTTLPNLIQHLKGDDHLNSWHLLNHKLCNKINLFWCTHYKCSSTSNTFFHPNVHTMTTF